MIKEDAEISVDDLRKVMEDLNILTKQDLLSNNEAWKTIPGYEQFLLNLSNCQIQDILEEFGMLENGNCPYTAEEIFKAGIEYAINKGFKNYKTNLKECIAWFEKQKQGEQNQKHFELKAGHWYICHRAFCCRADHLTVKEGERFMCEKDGVVKGFVIKDPEKYFKEVCALAPIKDKQKTTDKVEPKFKVGDWIVYNRDDCSKEIIGDWIVYNNDCSKEIIQVYDIRDGRYYFTDNVHFSWSIKECDEKSHLWTIQDVKDGDVLEFGDHGRPVVGIVSYVNKTTGKVDVNCLLENNNFKMGNYYNLDTIKPHPATKEQHDILFQKMKDAGYEWDAEKKELKKIEQKPAWSEEDEEMIRRIRCYLNEFGNWLSDKNEEKSQSIYKACDWLKSIKPNHWKPSEFQLECLRRVIPHQDTEIDNELEYVLTELYDNLKKL